MLQWSCKHRNGKNATVAKRVCELNYFSMRKTKKQIYDKNGIYFMPSYGLLTNPSNDIIGEINKICELDFEYVEIGIEGPEGNPDIINNKTDEIMKLLQ